jgi:hypothetical protein
MSHKPFKNLFCIYLFIKEVFLKILFDKCEKL